MQQFNMAQSLLGVLTGVQNVTMQPCSEENASFDEEDVFQCGKCKKQFHSISEFLAHKKESCIQLRTSVLPMISSASTSPILHFSNPLTTTASIVRPVQIATSFETISAAMPQNVIGEAEFLTMNGMESSTITIPIHSLTSSETFLTPVSSPSVNVTSPIVGTISAINPITVPLQNVSLATSINASSLLAVKTIPSTFAKESSVENHIVIEQNGIGTLADDNPTLCEEHKTVSDGEVLKYDLVIKFQNEDQTAGEEAHLNDGNLLGVDPMISSNIDSKLKKRVKILNPKTDLLGKLQCNYCGKGFTKKFDLEQHVRSHTGEKPFQCLVCGRAFAQRSNVKKHMQTHKVWPVEIFHTITDKRKTVEDVSDPKQNEGLSLDNRKEAEGCEISVDTSYICQFCNQAFPEYGQLKSHLKLHKSEQVYKCIIKSCSEVFKDLDTYLEHTRSHEKDMNYRCHICSKLYTSLSDLSFHQYFHEAEVQKPSNKKVFSCSTCQNKYSTLNALDHHRSTCSHHFPCPYCEKVYHSERFLRRHMLTHNSVSSHKCETCGKYFKTEHYLRLHTLIHSGDKPFQCLQCSASFNRKDKLKRHLLIHEPVKRFKCPFRTHTGCTKEFHRPDKLKAHIITHSGIKPYQCCHCKRTFSRCSTLKVHVRQVHNETGVLVCAICRKGFESESRLIEHTCSKEILNKSVKRQTNSASHIRYGRLHSKRCSNFGNQSFGNKSEKSQTKKATNPKKTETVTKGVVAKPTEIDDCKRLLAVKKRGSEFHNTNDQETSTTVLAGMEESLAEDGLLNFENS